MILLIRRDSYKTINKKTDRKYRYFVSKMFNNIIKNLVKNKKKSDTRFELNFE